MIFPIASTMPTSPSAELATAIGGGTGNYAETGGPASSHQPFPLCYLRSIVTKISVRNPENQLDKIFHARNIQSACMFVYGYEWEEKAYAHSFLFSLLLWLQKVAILIHFKST